jgi:hypothetical protein
MSHRDLGTGETGAGVQSDTVAACTPVHLDLAGIRLEACGGVFGGDTALDGETTTSDGFLGESEGGESRTSRNLDLGGDEVDAGDLLCRRE